MSIGVLSIITRVLIKGRQEHQSRDVMTKKRLVWRTLKMEGQVMSPGMLSASGSWKRQGTDFPLESPEGTQPSRMGLEPTKTHCRQTVR